jgi:hypothetical protein
MQAPFFLSQQAIYKSCHGTALRVSSRTLKATRWFLPAVPGPGCEVAVLNRHVTLTAAQQEAPKALNQHDVTHCPCRLRLWPWWAAGGRQQPVLLLLRAAVAVAVQARCQQRLRPCRLQSPLR